MKSAKPRFIISINLHDDAYFEDQLENIKNHLKFDYKIILNCNNKMYDLLKNKKYENVLINPKTIEKKRFHGSLFQGIFENLKFVESITEYDYFLVLSARSFFFKKLDSETINSFYDHAKCYGSFNIDYYPKTEQDWKEWPPKMWENHINSDFYSFLQKNKFNFQKGMHEGLLLTKKNGEDIISFFDKNEDLYKSVINTFNPMEEVVIQSLLFNWQKFTTIMGVWPGMEDHPDEIGKKYICKRY